MKTRDIFTVYFKELRDTLRDRRTIITMFVLPTILMPTLIFGFGFMSIRSPRKRCLQRTDRMQGPLHIAGNGQCRGHGTDRPDQEQ